MNDFEKQIIKSHYKKRNNSTLSCCSNPDIKNVSGLYTCINCGLVEKPQIKYGWVDYNPHNFVNFKSVYNRTYYVKRKLSNLKISHNDIEAFMEVWTFVENQLKIIAKKRFPKLDFFICKVLEFLHIPQRPTYKISSSMKLKYEAMWREIFNQTV